MKGWQVKMFLIIDSKGIRRRQTIDNQDVIDFIEESKKNPNFALINVVSNRRFNPANKIWESYSVEKSLNLSDNGDMD